MDDKTLLVFLGQMKDDIIQLTAENKAEHKDVMGAINANREEFVIFKTKVNTRTALISIAIGAVVTAGSLIMNFTDWQSRREAKRAAPIESVE